MCVACVVCECVCVYAVSVVSAKREREKDRKKEKESDFVGVVWEEKKKRIVHRGHGG